jgi:hypothetical protein
VRKLPGTPKRRRYTVIQGVSPPVTFSAYNDDLVALERAVKERVFFVKNNGSFVEPPKPRSVSFVFDRLECFYNGIRTYLPSTVPLTRHAFALSFRGRKQKIYLNAVDSLNVTPFSIKDSYVSTFLKYEKTKFGSTKIPVPRVISPRKPRYNVEIGRYIRTIEAKLFKSIGQLMGPDTVMKGMNATQMASAFRRKWNSFKDPVAVSTDFSRCDQHFSEAMLRWEHNMYLLCFPLRRHRRQLAHILKLQLVNKCFGRAVDGEVKYTVTGGRMSGDMNTSLGTCLAVCAMFYSLFQDLGVKAELCNNGDDCVIIMERVDSRKLVNALPNHFLDLGFTVEVEPLVDVFEQITFCQTQPVYCGPGADDYLMVRDPRVAIAKDSICMHLLQNDREVKAWMRAVGEGGIALAGQMPIWQAFYGMYLRSSTGVKSRQLDTAWGWGVRKLAEGNNRMVGAISAATRASYYWAFGITPDEQECIESFYSQHLVSGHAIPNVPEYVTLPF